MKYILIDTNPRMVDAWKEFFSKEKLITILEGDIASLRVDAIVSPANSFGIMDGSLGKELQKQINALPERELLVGKSLTLETGNEDIPYLISAPTMRISTHFNIDTSINAYLAMKAVLIAVENNENITSIAIPGLCTGVGKMSPIISARQMYYAWQEIVLEKKRKFKSFGEAQKYHWNLNPQGLFDPASPGK